jgi:hypothetical protein
MGKVMTEIRDIPQFHQFLLPKGYSEPSTVSHHGFVIIVNVSSFRCDSLAIKVPGAPPHHIHSNGFSGDKVEQLKDRLYNILTKKGLHNEWHQKEIQAGGPVISLQEDGPVMVEQENGPAMVDKGDEGFRSILV